MPGLFDSLLSNQGQSFAPDAEQAQRMASLRDTFQRLGIGAGGQQASARPVGALDPYRLPHPFDPTQQAPRARMMTSEPSFAPKPNFDQLEQMMGRENESFSEQVKSLPATVRKIMNPEDPWASGAGARNPLEEVERLQRELEGTRGEAFSRSSRPGAPQAKGYFASSTGAPRPQRMSPLAGPDTGEVDPNAAGSLIPRGYLQRLAGPESANNPSAENPAERTNRAAGLLQFKPSTWQSLMREAPQLGLTPEGIWSRDQQMRAGQYYTEQSVNKLLPILGRGPSMGELYALHLLGHTGGETMFKNPTTPLGEMFPPEVFKYNPWIDPKWTSRQMVPRLSRMMGE